jgi:hypothetical protein
MDKKDIYEHLAKIYLDASGNKPKQKKDYPHLKLFFFFALAVIFSITALIFPQIAKNKSQNFEIALVIQPDLAKINFNFDPAKKEIYSVNLNRLNLAKYKSLAFAVKKADYKDLTSLRVEFTNAFKEKSEIYLKDIPHRWKDFKIALSDFKGITDWSEMSNLSFIIEQWNTKEKHGIVYVDNIRFLK